MASSMRDGEGGAAPVRAAATARPNNDPLSMPPLLLAAHQRLDAVVNASYSVPCRRGFKTDAERVAFLFERYRDITSLLPERAPARKAAARGRRATASTA